MRNGWTTCGWLVARCGVVLGAMAGGCSTSEGPEERSLAGESTVVTSASFAAHQPPAPSRALPVDDLAPEPPKGFTSPRAAADEPVPTRAATGDAGYPVVSIGGVPHMGTEAAPAPAAGAAVPVTTKTVVEPTLTTAVNQPPTLSQQANAKGVTVLVESLVGQINGRPVFASEILDPLDGRLRQLGATAANPQAWATGAVDIIQRELNSRVYDELVLAEAKRNLTPEQKQGLFHFLDVMQSNLASTQKGSSIAADEALKESTGRGLREEAQDKLDQELIRKEMRDKVASRITVSWTDIKNEYDRSYEKYNPPSTAYFRMINTRDPNTATKIAEELEQGKPFAEVAASALNAFNRPEGGALSGKFRVTQAETEYLANPQLNEVCRTLTVGQVVGPISYNARITEPGRPAAAPDMRTAWITLEKIETPPGVSLYDAQLEISSQLSARRQTEEVARYFDQLRKRGNITLEQTMTERLLKIATERYAPRFLNPQALKTQQPQKK